MNPEDLLVAWLTGRYPGKTFSTERPADLAAALPYVQVVGIGGTSSMFRTGSQGVYLHVLADTRQASRTLAKALERDLLENLPNQTLGTGLYVRGVTSTRSPMWVPDANTTPAYRHFTLGVVLELHDRS